MKRKYLLLTMIIFGLKALGIDIAVFLEPLMQDMEILWKEGVEMLDELVKSAFTLRAIIFVTIADYPGQFSLIGQIKGFLGCSECLIFTAS